MVCIFPKGTNLLVPDRLKIVEKDGAGFPLKCFPAALGRPFANSWVQNDGEQFMERSSIVLHGAIMGQLRADCS